MLTIRDIPARRTRARRAFSMIEVLVFMAVIALVAGAFTVSAIAATKTQRAHKQVDIASQASAGLLEKAQYIPWGNLGFLDTDPGYTASYETRPTVTLTSEPAGDRIHPVTEVEVKGIPVTLTTHITWLRAPDPASITQYGTKRITAIATWNEDGTERTGRYSVDRTSEPNEAVVDETIALGDASDVDPIDVPVPTPSANAGGATEDGKTGYEYGGWTGHNGGDGGDVVPCAPLTATGGYARVYFSWEPVFGASYRLYVDGTLVASPTAGTSSYKYLTPNYGSHTFRLDTVKNGQVSTGCTTRTAVVQEPPPMTCPQVTIETSPGTATLSWTEVTAVHEYVIYHNGSLARTVEEPATGTVFTGLAPGNHTFRVDARLLSDTSAGCATQTVLVPAPIPDCPAATISTNVEAGSVLFTFNQVADASAYHVWLDGVRVANLAHTGTGTPRSHNQTGVAPGTHTGRVDVVGLTGDVRTCASQSFDMEKNEPTCPSFTAAALPDGSIEVALNTPADRVDTYIVKIDGTEVGRIDKSAVPTTRTYAPTSWGGFRGPLSVVVDGYQNMTGITTSGCAASTVDTGWPTTVSCPATGGFTATTYGRTIVGQVSPVSGVETFLVEVLDAGGTVVWSGTLNQRGGSWATSNVDTGQYTVRLTVDNPNTSPLQCTPPLTVTMPPPEISDTFSGSGVLGISEVGQATYLYPNGATWSRTSGYGRTSTAIGSNPMTVVDAGFSDIDLTASTPSGSGEALYYRVADATNWLRLRTRHYTQQRTVPTYTTYYQIADVATETYVSGYNVGPWYPVGDGYVCYVNRPSDQYSYGYLSFDEYGRGTSCQSRTGIAGSYNYYVRQRDITPIYSQRQYVAGYYWSTSSSAPYPDYWTGSTSQSQTGSYTVTDNYYEVVADKSVNGTITTQGTYPVSQPGSIRVVATGSTLKVYRNTALLATLTETAHQTATKHGVGLGGPTTASSLGIDSFRLVYTQ